ncbi:MAG: outer membrane beta-barrel protein [Rhodobacterales bacterium]|nr:outer membrane beta-barrel protein [Rhodobacterales bacterium]
MYSVTIATVFVVVASQSIAGSTNAPAGETPVTLSTATAEFSWTGFYAGLGLSRGTAADATDAFDTSGTSAHLGYLRDLGTFLLGGELAYSDADLDDVPTSITSTRIKLIGAYDAGHFLPYAFVGLSDIEISNGPNSISDTVSNYGLGVRYAFGLDGRFVAGLEYLVEDKNNFASSGENFDLDDVTLRLDYRF